MDQTQQLLLWRWSTLVQLSSLAMIAAFFALLARTNPRPELKWWARAWAFNLLAILFTSLFWVTQSAALLPMVAVIYVAGKSAFTLMLMQGAWSVIRTGGRLFTSRTLTIGVAAYSVAVAAILRDVTPVGIAQHSLMGVALLVFAAVLLRSHSHGLTWLIAGFALRGLLAITEAGAYVLQQVHPSSGAFAGWLPFAESFVSASSSFDTGSEWLLVLGSVLAVSERGRRQLEDANRDLVSAQENLRRLADRDPLTGTINRRALREIFNDVQDSGEPAMLLFFDLDGFKQINDVHGHAAGDSCLELFANALRESFRPDDHVVRYGGDELLVIAPGLDSAAARERIEELTKMMAAGDGISCGFSVGMSELAAGGSPEIALQSADQNMYKAKHQERGRE